MAEYRQDAEVFAIIAYRFEKELQAQRNTYSRKTREYFRRRVWRTLKTLGEESDVKYVPMAVEVLLQYTDAASSQSSIQYVYDGKTRHWDSYSSYLTFGHILYENSPRYVLSRSAKYWQRRWDYEGNLEPEVREEAFPELWQQQPEALIKLLLESNCHLVHHFAVKAVKDCPKFCEALELNTLIKLLDRPYEITAGFAFELGRDRYDANNPNLELILGLANSPACRRPPTSL